MLLEEAHQITKLKGLVNLHQQVTVEQKKVKTEVDKWKSLLAQNAPVQERIEQAELEDYVLNALKLMDAFQKNGE